MFAAKYLLYLIARCEVSASIYIAYISVNKFTSLAGTGPHGQLASIELVAGKTQGFVLRKE